MQLYARTTGTGTPVILLHGLFGAQENLGMLTRQLATGYRIHALDLRNHGKSPHSDKIDYPCMSADLLEYITEQQLTQVDLIGHSMGGKVAMQFALNHPNIVRRLAVLDMAPVAYSHRHQSVFNALQAVHPEQLSKRQEADSLMAPYLSEASLRQFLLQNLVRDGDHLRWRFHLKALIKNYPKIIDAVTGEAPFTGPTLFLKGGDSDYLLPEHRETIKQLFPKARVRLFERCGHWLHAEAPERVAHVLKQFLAAT